MKISIIIPLYNQQEYISDAIESALSQTVKPHEIIVINDGSTDNSLEIARKYPIKVINQTNRGLPSARNTGIMNATGDYILPLDADDILLENCLDKITQETEKTDADIISPSFKEFGIRDTKIILMPNPTIEDFKTANRVAYCSAIKKDALLEVGGYSSKMVWGYEDYALWFNLLTRGKAIITIPEVLWLYRTKEHSMINDSIAHHEELMKQIAKDFPDVFPEYVEIKTPLPK